MTRLRRRWGFDSSIGEPFSIRAGGERLDWPLALLEPEVYLDGDKVPGQRGFVSRQVAFRRRWAKATRAAQTPRAYQQAMAEWLEPLLRIGSGWDAGGARLALGLEGMNCEEVAPRLMTWTYRDLEVEPGKLVEPWLKLAKRDAWELARTLAGMGHSFIGSVERGAGGRLHHHHCLVSHKGSDEEGLVDALEWWETEKGYTHRGGARMGAIAEYAVKHQGRIDAVGCSLGLPWPGGVKLRWIP